VTRKTWHGEHEPSNCYLPSLLQDRSAEIFEETYTRSALRTEAGVTLTKLTGRPSNEASDAYASRLYFVSVLEQVLEVLAPQSSVSSDESQASAEGKLSNNFEALEVEETMLGLGDAEASSSKKKAKQTQGDGRHRLAFGRSRKKLLVLPRVSSKEGACRTQGTKQCIPRSLDEEPLTARC
jgi:hypothetical protein